MPLIFLVWVVLGWLQIVAAHTGGGEGFFNGLLEQKRIAHKLDAVLNCVDSVNTRLARVAPILKRFRQSVLAAATSGRLTEDWRQKNSFTVDIDAIAKKRLTDFESDPVLRKQWRNREPDNLQLTAANQDNQYQTPENWL